MMVGIRQFISKWLAREANERRLPSLVRALQRVAPHSVVKEVVGTSSDRRQWGVLTAAWLGVSERELTRAVAQEMKREFVERLPRLALEELAGDKRALLEQMRDIGLVPIFDGPAIVKYIAVDPAEVRGFTLYTGRETVSIGCWSDISRILDDASRELQSEDDTREYQLQRQHQELCMKVVELLIHEARSHGARTLELVSVEGGARYQFEAADGRRGRGNVHKGIVSSLCRFLTRLDGHCLQSEQAGEVLVRTLGCLTDYRLSWGTKNDGQVEMTGAHTLPSPVSGTERVVPFVQPEAGSGANSEVKSGTTRAQGEPILIVDDNPMFVRVLERLLSRDGYAPRFAENGAAALEKLSTMETLRPRAIVCDLHMPKMNGKEFVAHIRSEPLWRSIPIVMLTSDDDVEAEVSLLNLGVDAVVSKTKDPRVLVAHVRRVTREKSQKVAA